MLTLVGGYAVMFFTGTYWTGPKLTISDGPDDDGCWEILKIDTPRKRMRHWDNAILETSPVPWHEVTIHRVNASQLTFFPETMPTTGVIPHGLQGTMDVGDVACTGRVSQLWVLRPIGQDPSVILWQDCYEGGWQFCTGGSQDEPEDP